MAKSSDDRSGTSQTSPTSASGNTFRYIKAEKCAVYDITLPDEDNCLITGLSITSDGRRLLADCGNRKIKMFSRDMKIITSLPLPDLPRDMAVTGDREAVVGVDGSKLIILDVSDKQMSIRRTVKLSLHVWGIVAHKDKLIVTSRDPSPHSVKLIDHSGNVYWSTSTDQQGQRLFSHPVYVACFDDGRSSTAIATDDGNSTLTLLDSNTGDVICRREVLWKVPHGVTTDPTGNAYVYYWGTDEVAVWTRDLSEEKILLTMPPHSVWPRPAIACDTVADELVVIHDMEDE